MQKGKRAGIAYHQHCLTRTLNRKRSWGKRGGERLTGKVHLALSREAGMSCGQTDMSKFDGYLDLIDLNRSGIYP